MWTLLLIAVIKCCGHLSNTPSPSFVHVVCTRPHILQLESRSGNRDQFISMVNRCNAAGVNVIADLVINHMTGHGSSGTGTGGSGFNGGSLDYPGVPFGFNDFHQPYCEIRD